MTTWQEAQRIWTSHPVSEWKAEIAKLPESMLICGIVWKGYRAGVREALRIAWIGRETRQYAGMSAANLFCAGAGSLQVESDSDERH